MMIRKTPLYKWSVALSVAVALLTGMSAGADSAAAASTYTQSARTGAQIVSTAKSYLGKVTYRYGVRNPGRLQFDCSAYTQYVFKRVGITIPWGSRAQAKAGVFVPKSRLQPGDLVFFSVGTPGRIDHVGIYVGGGQFISNSPSKGVSISKFTDSYWKTRYITARRVR
ncbi:C40 family peptidase [Paenibacillus chartarius]|uniref:C40 family peptidase n=1 Tax=Paenibacillus chartarius TaxID=747481 RepID=A0ABV6DTT3_9BACL